MDPVLSAPRSEGTPPAPQPPAQPSLPGLDLRAGAVLFSRFSLVRPLGQGRCSITWLAQDDRFHGEVALKIFYLGTGRDTDELRLVWQRLLRQLRILNHPNICLPLELFLEEPWGAVDSDLAEGQTLAACLKALPSQKMSYAQAAPLLLQVGRALHSAHGQVGVVHGNLNACNVIVDQGRKRARITDFGVFPPPAAPGEASLAAGDFKSGTLAPERLQGGGPSFADDLYAFGALCFRTFTGLRPDESPERNRETLREVAGLPEDWQQQIAAALAPLPQRPPDMQSLLSGVKAHAALAESAPIPALLRKSLVNPPVGESRAKKLWMIFGGLLFFAAIYLLIHQHLHDTRTLQDERLKEEALEKLRGDPEKEHLREMEKQLGLAPIAPYTPDQPADAPAASPAAGGSPTPTAVPVINSQAQELLASGQASQKAGDPQAALTDFELATVLQENWPELLEARASALSDLNRQDDALKGYTDVLALAPARASALLARGKIYASQNQPDLARADFTAALQAEPGLPGAQEALDALH